jgi:hypothetical protein
MLVPGLFAKPEMEPVSNYVPETALSSLRGCMVVIFDRLLDGEPFKVPSRI